MMPFFQANRLIGHKGCIIELPRNRARNKKVYEKYRKWIIEIRDY